VGTVAITVVVIAIFTEVLEELGTFATLARL
jgi:hypothetical protein